MQNARDYKGFGFQSVSDFGIFAQILQTDVDVLNFQTFGFFFL
jgi:hypothetical protein